MPAVPRETRARSITSQATLDLALLSTEQLLDYASTWRRLAHEWSVMASDFPPAQAARFRHTAQTALYTANEAEELLKDRERLPPLPHGDRTPK